MESAYNIREQKLLAISLAITLDNMRYTAGMDIVDADIEIPHSEEFSPAVFKR